MSSRGVFGIDRGIWSHPAFDREPFTQREAWMWMISEAAFRPYGRRVDGKELQLDRGQLCHSVRFMAEAWQWSKSRVDRFLNVLEKQDMIRREHGTRTPVLTICNYDDYQNVSLPKRDEVGTTCGTRAGQERDKLEDTKTINSLLDEKQGPKAEVVTSQIEVLPIVKPARQPVPALFDEFWAAYPKRDGENPKAPAKKKFDAAVKSGADPAAIIAGTKAYAAAEARRGKVGTPYIAQAQTWLNGRRWEDHAPSAVPSGVAAPAADPAEPWRVPVKRWLSDPSSWWNGPPPGEPGCPVPEAVLIEFGILRRGAA